MAELGRRFGSSEWQLAEHHLTGGSVHGDPLALPHDDPVGDEVALVDVDVGHADRRGYPPSPGDDCGVAHEAASTRQHRFRRLHAVDVVG